MKWCRVLFLIKLPQANTKGSWISFRKKAPEIQTRRPRELPLLLMQFFISRIHSLWSTHRWRRILCLSFSWAIIYPYFMFLVQFLSEHHVYFISITFLPSFSLASFFLKDIHPFRKGCLQVFLPFVIFPSLQQRDSSSCCERNRDFFTKACYHRLFYCYSTVVVTKTRKTRRQGICHHLRLPVMD